jgi:diadenylate cyclase
LAHLGRAPFFRYLAKAESAEESIEELVVAAGTLSAQRVGAIIVVERQIGLRNYIEGGIPLEAVMTYDLLVAIFQPSSPLHDGAVIVQDDRVAAAACFLPLTVNPKLGKELGSRHRAAIGLTEENDALAVVVSEETGGISLASDGAIERGLDGDMLRDRLRSMVLQRRSRAAVVRTETA